MKNTLNGRIKIRKRYINVFKDKKKKYVLLVLESKEGIWEGYTLFPTVKEKYIDKTRNGA